MGPARARHLLALALVAAAACASGDLGGTDAAPPPPDAAPHPDAPACTGDQDGDGYGTGGLCLGFDCDDLRRTVHPGATETCNGIDDDCNGPVDEGIADLSCGVGPCATTAPACVGGAPKTCTPLPAGIETCNSIDDDCDGTVDNNLPDLVCGEGACATVAPACVGGSPGTCTPLEPGTESCNNLDDDCDGTVDEDLPTVTCGVGLCEVTQASCAGGVPQDCTPLPGGTETCNDVDDDCDGEVDEEGCVLNNLRADAIEIVLGATEVVVSGTTENATHDAPDVACSCTDGKPDVWYFFTLTESAAVYLDTAGSGRDTSLLITDDSGALVPAQEGNGRSDPGLCNDDAGCGSTTGGWTSSLESRTWGWFAAGTYFVGVAGCSSGAFTLRAQLAPDSMSAFFFGTRISGNDDRSTVLIGTSVDEPECSSSVAPSGEDAHWLTTCGTGTHTFSLCPSDSTATLTAGWQRGETDLSGAKHDAVIYVRSAQTGAQAACDDDDAANVATDCRGYYGTTTTSYLDSYNWGSRLGGVTLPRGLNVLFVDDRLGNASGGMNYSLLYDIGS